MNKKYLRIGLIFLIIALGLIVWLLTRSGVVELAPAVPETSEITPTPTPQEPEKSPFEEPKEPETKSDLDQIREAFAEKYSKPIEDVDVNISENTGTHASGGVRFAGEMGGGMWLAYNDGEKWLITYDGHGTISCEAVDPYGFPTEMISECWDENAGQLIQRD